MEEKKDILEKIIEFNSEYDQDLEKGIGLLTEAAAVIARLRERDKGNSNTINLLLELSDAEIETNVEEKVKDLEYKSNIEDNTIYHHSPYNNMNWTENKGKQPVEDDVKVDVMFGDNKIINDEYAGNWDWSIGETESLNVRFWKLSESILKV